MIFCILKHHLQKVHVDLPRWSFNLSLDSLYKRGLILPLYLGDKMRGVAGLLLLLISLSGSQAQCGGEGSEPDVKALKDLLAELVLKLTFLETDVSDLKAELTLGTQNMSK